MKVRYARLLKQNTQTEFWNTRAYQ